MLRLAIPAFFALLTFASATQAQLSNNGFETVDITSTDTTAENWTSQDFGSGINTNAHSGAYAMSVWNWYWYAQGLVLNGTSEAFPPPVKGQPYLSGGEPIAFKPLALSGFYLYDTVYTQSQNDSAMVQITLSRYNTISQEREALGFGQILLTHTTQYQAFSIPVNYFSSLMPDTVAVILQSSLSGFCGSMTSGYCLYLTVDDLVLETASGVVAFADKDLGIKAYPNPSQNVLNIDATHMDQNLQTCMVTDLNGRLVLEKAVAQNKVLLDVSGLQPGLYFYQLKNTRGQVVHTGKAEVSR